jgi:beta-glucosidase
MVTENGSAYDDATRSADGSVQDDDRIAYLRDHLAATRRARAAGVDVRAYLAWTLLDNFEWAYGYTKKFGLVEVETDTLRRIPKASYRSLAQIVSAAAP